MIPKFIRAFPEKYYAVEILLGISLFVGLFGYMNLSSSTKIASDSSHKVVFLLDVSQSMNVRDMPDNTRLGSAKRHIFEELQKYQGYEYALTIFAAVGQRTLPFMQDPSLFGTILSGVSSRNILEQGTDYNAGISEALKNFSKEDTGILYIYSDGHDEAFELQEQIRETIESQGIEVRVVGVGSSRGGYVPGVTYRGKRVLSRLEAGSLRNLASDLGGKYYDLGDTIKRGESSKSAGAHWYIYLLCSIWFISLYLLYRRVYV